MRMTAAINRCLIKPANPQSVEVGSFSVVAWTKIENVGFCTKSPLNPRGRNGG